MPEYWFDENTDDKRSGISVHEISRIKLQLLSVETVVRTYDLNTTLCPPPKGTARPRNDLDVPYDHSSGTCSTKREKRDRCKSSD